MGKELTSKEVFDKILHKVDCKYGAPMGMDSWGKKPTDKRVFCRSVPLIDGYDRMGAYFGFPSNVFVEYTKDMEYVRFFRKDNEYFKKEKLKQSFGTINSNVKINKDDLRRENLY